ncbi:actin-related protein 2/3 complex subunit 4 isoform X2 [Rhincodon typus]|uniref:actin-related protein 2/3 complex subunit 4 isoform X2 n=1 Tax=Rhincodon typus TaxID=259920 RepID=UPI00202DC7DF|nr:actin-related protein 2/3 complex subunit 4 isoform X2 [Rhincodon typus]
MEGKEGDGLAPARSTDRGWWGRKIIGSSGVSWSNGSKRQQGPTRPPRAGESSTPSASCLWARAEPIGIRAGPARVLLPPYQMVEPCYSSSASNPECLPLSQEFVILSRPCNLLSGDGERRALIVCLFLVFDIWQRSVHT